MNAHLRRLAAFLLIVAFPVQALAQPHVVAELGRAPLVGEIASTPQLQADVSRQRRLFETAGSKLGLSSSEYAQFESRIAARQVSYVSIPRHLDAMTWSSAGTVYVLHDVVIPANTMGWEIDVPEGNQIVALFVPAKCGNLSLLRKPLPRIAAAPAFTAPRAPRLAVQATPAPAPRVEAAVETPVAPAATPAPYQSVAASTGPVHHARLWPLLLLPILALVAGSHGGSTAPIAPPVTASAPLPLPSPPCLP